MRGMTSHDGKMHGNAQMVERYDQSKSKKPQRPHATGGESGGEHEASGHDEVKSVVGEHGPAHTHIITKTGGEQGGSTQEPFHSETHHDDGHVHHADHSTMVEAHEHGEHAMGPASEDTEHVGDMDKDDSEVAGENDRLRMSPSTRTSNIGFMK